MKNIVVENLLNYDVPALCSIIAFSSDYSTETVIYSKLILNEAGYDSPKTEKEFSKFKTKKNITESEIQRLNGELSKIFTRRESEAAKRESEAAKRESEAAKREGATNNINQNSSNADVENYVEEAGLKLKLIGNVLLCSVLFQAISLFIVFNVDVRDLQTVTLITGVLQIILFIVILMGFFDAGNALIKSSKSKNGNN